MSQCNRRCVTWSPRLPSLLQPKGFPGNRLEPILGAFFSWIYTDFWWGVMNKKLIKNCGQSLFFFLLLFFSFFVVTAKYLLLPLLPLLPIRILWKLHGVITVTIVTGIVGPLLQRLLGDGLGPPILLVVGLAALGVWLVKHVRLPLSTDVSTTIAPGPTRTTASLWLERSSPPSSTPPWTTTKGRPSLGIAPTASCGWCAARPTGRRPPPAWTSATAPHAVHIFIAVVRVFIATTVVMIVVAIVVIIIVFISIVIWWIGIAPSATSPPASAWRWHTWRWVIVVVVIPTMGKIMLNWVYSLLENKSGRWPGESMSLCLTQNSLWSAELLGALSSSCLGV